MVGGPHNMKNCMKSHIMRKVENHWLRILSPPSFSPQSRPDFLFPSCLSLNVEAQDLRYIASWRCLPTLNFTSLCEAKGHVCVSPSYFLQGYKSAVSSCSSPGISKTSNGKGSVGRCSSVFIRTLMNLV